jgi:Matrixin
MAFGQGVSAAASPPPCSDSAYGFIGPGSAWASTLGWRFRSSSVPSGLSTSGVLAVIKKSFRNVVNARNNCGRSDHVSATQNYLGTTTRGPNVTAAGSCGSPDGTSVVAFAPLDGSYLAYTCIWWNGANHIYEMDMRLDPAQSWAVSLATCNGEWMLEAVVTHEAGHAFGLAHVGEANHGRLTMSPNIDGVCENRESTLGLGDVLGLEALY